MQSPGTYYSIRTLPLLQAGSSPDFSLTPTCRHTSFSNFSFRRNSPFRSRSSRRPPAIRLCPLPPQIYVPWKPVRRLFLRVIPRDFWIFIAALTPNCFPVTYLSLYLPCCALLHPHGEFHPDLRPRSARRFRDLANVSACRVSTTNPLSISSPNVADGRPCVSARDSKSFKDAKPPRTDVLCQLAPLLVC